jgi:hypothetical protein
MYFKAIHVLKPRKEVSKMVRIMSLKASHPSPSHQSCLAYVNQHKTHIATESYHQVFINQDIPVLRLGPEMNNPRPAGLTFPA